jgi:nucleotide-binding universal stress UspA family protein
MPHRRSRKFLCLVDSTPECRVAIRFAARRAEATRGHVALAYVIEPADFHHWMAVEDKIREEAYSEAERALYEAATIVNATYGGRPELVIREGHPREELSKLVQEDRSISILVLGAGAGKEGPGPIISALMAGDFGRDFPVPITIVPGGRSEAEIDTLG